MTFFVAVATVFSACSELEDDRFQDLPDEEQTEEQDNVITLSFDREMPMEMEPNSTIDVGYVIESAKDVTVRLTPSSDLKAEVVPADKTSGVIRITSGNVISGSSQVLVIVSDGKNTVSRRLNFIPAEGDIFEISPTEVILPVSGGDFKITVTTNIGYSISGMSDWIEAAGTETDEQGRTVVHSFKVAANPSEESRTGNVTFCNDSQVCMEVIVKQSGVVNVEGKSFHHRSVAVRYTADWCGYCPNMATAFDQASDDMPGKLEVISMHCDGALKFSNPGPLTSQFHVSGYPMGILDGRMLIQNYDLETIVRLVKKYAEETETVYSTASGMSMSSVVNGKKLSVNVSAYLKYPESYKITALLVEDNIVGYQANYYTGDVNDYVHNGIPRLALTELTGDSFSTSTENEMKEFTFNATIPNRCNADNLRVVVYIQRTYGSREIIRTEDYGEYYIDNCISGKVGTYVEVKFAE